jgi:poly(hydroxyalkanoate) depolymerase family esterase
MKRESKAAIVAITRVNSRFTKRCGRITLHVLVPSLVLLPFASPQAFAASPVAVTNFGSNPGDLRMFKYIPDGLPASAPLVVVMHGCTENARTFAAETGWIQLADKFGLALALPEQTQANNPQNCFRWFDSNQNRRDQGEALSIKQMVDNMKSVHNIDPKRVFVTGLSAGGAMTSVMLATYPDVFAGGGINAGLPYGCANDQSQAFQCMITGQPSFGGPVVGLSSAAGPATGSMSGQINVAVSPDFCQFFPLPPPICPSSGTPTPGPHTISPSEWGNFVRQASNFTGPFPKVSIWFGSTDWTVNPVNATEEMQQWTNVHGIDPHSGVNDSVKGFPHQTFKDANGIAMVETYSITGMGHGQPVDPGAAADQCGTADQYIPDEHICASFYIAKFWGLAR